MSLLVSVQYIMRPSAYIALNTFYTHQLFSAFEYFHSWCALSKLQTCWESYSVSENMIADIDLDNMIWRHVMMKLELTDKLVATNPLLCQNIQRLHERQEACLSAVQPFVSNDVIQHILFDYVTLM